ncbi:hypothetical protein EDC04DRAFT_2904881 [Pisolithus marmoratus]|nr:hypothetical protein EDC04DRAFT_2904881 [Pisolithus marmoratus]
MSHVKPSPNLPVKIGPPHRCLEVAENQGQYYATHQSPACEVVPPENQGIPPLETRLKRGMNLAWSLGVQPSSHMWHDVLHKMVTLSNGQQLHPHVALQQLHAGVISKEDIVQDDDCDEESSDKHSDWSTDKRHSLKLEQTRQEIRNGNYDFDHHPSTPPLEFPSSSEDEDAIMDIEDDSPKTKRKYAHPLTEVGMSWATSRTVDEGVDTDGAGGTEERSLNLKRGRLPMEAIREVQALGMCTMQEAQVIADKYGKMLISIMTATGLTSKATQAESVWNMHQAWYAHTNPKASREHMKDYYSRQTKHYEDHKDEEEFPQLWAEIHMFWSKSISGSKDTSSKAMVGRVMACRDSFTQAAQTWCNVEGIHVFGCVIYSRSDEAAHQAQGIFAGSALCMQLAGEKQMDISRLLDYLATIVKYKVLDSAASTLALKPQESRHDRNHHVLPVVFMHKLYEANLVGGQRNIPWKTLLDVLYTAQYTVIDWPAHVPAVGPDFNIRCLNANELRGLVVPFLKEQMGADYYAEAPGEDQDQDGSMVVPSLSFDLKKWMPKQVRLFRLADSEMFNIPLVSASKRCTSSQESIDVIPHSLLTTRGVTAALTIEPLTFTTK